MTATGIREGDVVEVDKRGVRFVAEVTARRRGELELRPFDRRFTWRSARPREVCRHWRLAGRSRAA